jgi:hypothetical protein
VEESQFEWCWRSDSSNGVGEGAKVRMELVKELQFEWSWKTRDSSSGVGE